MAAIENTLEWPRFCYSTASLFPDVKMAKSDEKMSDKLLPPVKKINRRKNYVKKPTPGVKLAVRLNLESEDDVHLGQTERLPFSELMRNMAKKYQHNDDEMKEEQQKSGPFSLLGSSGLDPLVLRAAISHYFPFASTQPPQASLFPPFEVPNHNLASRKRSGEETLQQIMESKRQRMDDPLDLSAANQGVDPDDVDVDVLSIDSPEMTRLDVDCWSVEQVCSFVSSVESCQDYSQAFRDHCIDGSALLELTETHLTGILGFKLGPAMRLKNSIRELQKMPHSPSTSSNYSC